MSRVKLSWKSWPLRTTLTVIIAGLFVLAAGSALTIQYVVAGQALDQQVQTARVSGSGAGTRIPTAAPAPNETVSDEAQSCGGECDVASLPHPTPAANDVFQEVTTLRDSVMGTMGISLIASFTAFAVAAVLVARWVATRTVGRIATISNLAAGLDPSDLSQRLPESAGSDEIGELTHTFNNMLARIESAVAMQRQFIANASHELRTPIAAVQTNLEAPLDQGRFSADVEPSVRRALSANRKSAALIASLLQLARAHEGADLQLEPIDLAQIARREVAGLCGLIAEKTLDVAVGSTTGVAWADPVLSELVVRNVIDNAIRHAVAGGTVAVNVAQADAMVVLTVSNSAALGEDVDLAALLHPFHRGNGSRLAGAPGFGLGLAIVESAVSAQGGWVQLHQPDDHTFRIDLALPSAASSSGAEVEAEPA